MISGLGFLFLSPLPALLLCWFSKLPNPISFLDFHPISLCNFVHKILSKVLTLHLGGILPPIISENQAAFVKDRNITDNILLALELTHSISRTNLGGNLIIKLDLQKAFDWVSREFLQLVLFHFRFSSSFQPLVKNCVESYLFCSD